MESRDRAWRRHIESKKVIKRIKLNASRSRWWRFEDANNQLIRNPHWFDFIGTQSAYFYKNSSTNKYDTRHKVKWGKKGKKNYDWSHSYWTRHKDKARFKKELNDIGIKHFPTEF